MNNKGIYLGKFTYRDGGLVRMDPGGSATDKNDPKKTDNSQPYMYLDQKTNTWLRPPENRDQNQMIDWSVNQPAFSTGTMNIQGGKKVSPEEAARAKEYYRQEALKTPEGLEEERNRLMQEFVDQENANKSELQKSFGNLSLDNPATRDAARNYAGYKLGESNPKNMLDRMFTGSDEVGLRDFYRPHDSSMILTVPTAAAAASLAAGVAPLVTAAAPMVGAGFNAVKQFAKPAVDAWNSTLGTRLLGAAEMGASPGMQTAANLMTPANLLKAWGLYDAHTKYAPEAFEAGQMYYQTGNTKYLKDIVYNTGKAALEIGSHTGPIVHEVNAVKRPVSFADDARKMADANRDATDRGISGFKTFKNTMGILKKDGGDISLPNLKRVKIKALPKNWKSQ